MNTSSVMFLFNFVQGLVGFVDLMISVEEFWSPKIK